MSDKDYRRAMDKSTARDFAILLFLVLVVLPLALVVVGFFS